MILVMLNIFDSPIYLTRGGEVVENLGSLRYADRSGDYWAKSATISEFYAYVAYFDSGNSWISSNNDRWYGFTGR